MRAAGIRPVSVAAAGPSRLAIRRVALHRPPAAGLSCSVYGATIEDLAVAAFTGRLRHAARTPIDRYLVRR